MAGLEVPRDWMPATAHFPNLAGLVGPACCRLGALLTGTLAQEVSGCSKARRLLRTTLTP